MMMLLPSKTISFMADSSEFHNVSLYYTPTVANTQPANKDVYKRQVISSLMDMKAQDLFPYLENMNVCVGPVTEDMLPADANADNTVCIGVCCKKLADAKGFRWVVGCPPGNADVVKGILGDRKEYGVRYE